MLQNQRLKKTPYRIDFTGNLYRITLDGLAPKWWALMSSKVLPDFVACKNLPCQILFLWKVLDFVERRILAWRAEFDLVIGPFGTWPWGPLQNRGVQQGPPNFKEDYIYIYAYFFLFHTGDMHALYLCLAMLFASMFYTGCIHVLYQLYRTRRWQKLQNLKPDGDLDCCESWMAERIRWWTERWLELWFLEWLQWLQVSPGPLAHLELLDVVWCGAAVVV